MSGEYRAADYHVGFIAPGLIVAWMLVAPQIFSLGERALEGIAAFIVGALLSAHVPPLRRLLRRGKRLSANVERAARAVFYDLGTSRTTGRNGIFVFVSAFERRCAVVPDIGVDPDALGEAYRAACSDIHAAVRHLDLGAFATHRISCTKPSGAVTHIVDKRCRGRR